MLLDGDLEVLQILKKQYHTAKIKSVENTGVGFYVNFEISDNNLKLLYPKDNFSFGDVYGIYDGIFGAVGFILFIRNGTLACLEGYSNIGSEWPEDKNIELSYNTRGERDILNLLKWYYNFNHGK